MITTLAGLCMALATQDKQMALATQDKQSWQLNYECTQNVTHFTYIHLYYITGIINIKQYLYGASPQALCASDIKNNK